MNKLNKILLTLLIILTLLTNFYFTYRIDQNVKLIGELNIMIIQQNNKIIKNNKGKWI